MVTWKSHVEDFMEIQSKYLLYFLPVTALEWLSLWGEYSSYNTDIRLGHVASCGQWTMSRSEALYTKQKLSELSHGSTSIPYI